MLYRLTGASFGRAGCQVRTGTGHVLRTDLPLLHGGEDTAAQPIEMLLASLCGCKVATAHYVARYLWPRPYNRIESIEWEGVIARRDERGALALPITAPQPVSPMLTHFEGVARVVVPRGSTVSGEDVRKLGELVEQRCPIAAMFVASGCEMKVDWQLVQQ